jgi:hypothetical protein
MERTILRKYKPEHMSLKLTSRWIIEFHRHGLALMPNDTSPAVVIGEDGPTALKGFG